MPAKPTPTDIADAPIPFPARIKDDPDTTGDDAPQAA
jgi:hypothetical protein